MRLACIGISLEYLADAPVSEYTSREDAAAAAHALFALNPTAEEEEKEFRRAVREANAVPADAAQARHREAMEEFLEAGGDVDDPQAMLSMVASMLGPIDPSGPNEWILKAMDGEPYDKADAWIRWDQ